MIPRITPATRKVALEAAAPPAETIRCGIACKMEHPSPYMDGPERRPAFAGLTDQGTLVVVSFTPSGQPTVTVRSLLAMTRVRFHGILGRYTVRIDLKSGGKEEKLVLYAERREQGLPDQGTELERFLGTLRRLSIR